MKSITYKILTALYLSELFSGSPMTNVKCQMLNVSPQVLSRLLRQRFVLKDESGLRLNYLGANHLLSRFPLLGFLRIKIPDLYPSDPGSQARDKLQITNLTLVIFNIPESQRPVRDRLRYQLKTLGFGTVSRSVYLSPHWSVKEVRSFLQGLPLKGRPLGGGLMEPSTVVLRLPWESFKEIEDLGLFWQNQLSVCNDKYERAIASWEVKKDASGFLNHFIRGLWLDPLLPLPLSPKNSLINQCLEIAREIFTSISNF